jgi:MoxR-like ATPase
MTPSDAYELERQVVEQIRESRARIDAELSKVIVGQKDVVQQILLCLFAGGHCLITGAPGWPRRCWSARSRRSST